MQPKETIDLFIAGASFVGFLSTALLWYRTKVEKSYAAQRDFNHLKNSINSLSENIALLKDDQDDQLAEIKQILHIQSMKIDALPGGRRSTGWTSLDSSGEIPTDRM